MTSYSDQQAYWELLYPFNSLGWEDSLEKIMATRSTIFAWRIPWTEGTGGLRSIGSQRVRHAWSNSACTHACTYPFNPLWEWFQRAKVVPLTDSQKSIIVILIVLHLKSSLCCLVWTVYHHDDSFPKILFLYETLASYFCICLSAPKTSLSKHVFDPYLME